MTARHKYPNCINKTSIIFTLLCLLTAFTRTIKSATLIAETDIFIVCLRKGILSTITKKCLVEPLTKHFNQQYRKINYNNDNWASWMIISIFECDNTFLWILCQIKQLYKQTNRRFGYMNERIIKSLKKKCQTTIIGKALKCKRKERITFLKIYIFNYLSDPHKLIKNMNILPKSEKVNDIFTPTVAYKIWNKYYSQRTLKSS